MPRQQPRPIADDTPDQHHGWPLDTDRAATVACSVELDLSDRTVELVRILACGAHVALRTSVWSRTYESATDAEDAFAALDARQADLLHWSVGAMVFGPKWRTAQRRGYSCAASRRRNAQIHLVDKTLA